MHLPHTLLWQTVEAQHPGNPELSGAGSIPVCSAVLKLLWPKRLLPDLCGGPTVFDVGDKCRAGPLSARLPLLVHSEFWRVCSVPCKTGHAALLPPRAAEAHDAAALGCIMPSQATLQV